jgi:protein gp37
VGVSAVDKLHFYAACHYLSEITATVKFISFEPLLESMAGAQPIGEHLYNGGINWVIIGRQTPLSAATMPRIRDIREIIHAANEIPIPVFLKDNLKGFLPFAQYSEPWKEVYKLRQEFPKVEASK